MTRMPDAVEIEVVAGSGVEGARRATGGPDPATTLPARAPDPEVEATVQRRRFSVRGKQRQLSRTRRLVQHRVKCARRESRPRSCVDLGFLAGKQVGLGDHVHQHVRSRLDHGSIPVRRIGQAVLPGLSLEGKRV